MDRIDGVLDGVDYHQLYLVADDDLDGFPEGSFKDEIYPHTLVEPRGNSVCVHTGIAMGQVNLTIEVLEEAPDRSDDRRQWEAVSEVSWSRNAPHVVDLPLMSNLNRSDRVPEACGFVSPPRSAGSNSITTRAATVMATSLVGCRCGPRERNARCCGDCRPDKAGQGPDPSCCEKRRPTPAVNTTARVETRALPLAVPKTTTDRVTTTAERTT